MPCLFQNTESENCDCPFAYIFNSFGHSKYRYAPIADWCPSLGCASNKIAEKAEVEIEKHLLKFGIKEGDVDNRYGTQGFGHSIYIKTAAGNIVELRSQI